MKGLNHQLQLDIQIRKIEVVAANFFNSEQFGLIKRIYKMSYS